MKEKESDFSWNPKPGQDKIKRRAELEKLMDEALDDANYEKAARYMAEKMQLEFNSDFNNSAFEENGHVGLKDCAGKILIPAKYKSLNFSNAFMNRLPAIAVDDNDKFALIQTDGSGDRLTPFLYDDIYYIQEARSFAAKRNGKYGIISLRGNKLTPFEADSFESRANSLFVTKSGNKFGLWSPVGLYISPEYDEISEGKSGEVCARTGDIKGYFDRFGNFIDENDATIKDGSAEILFFRQDTDEEEYD